MNEKYKLYCKLIRKEELNLQLSLVQEIAKEIFPQKDIDEAQFNIIYGFVNELINSREFDNIMKQYTNNSLLSILNHNNDITDEYALDLYERYCTDNEMYDKILYPIHTIEDHYGPQVQTFLENYTDIPKKYPYYTIDNDDKPHWYTIEEAVTIANICVLNNLELIEKYK